MSADHLKSKLRTNLTPGPVPRIADLTGKVLFRLTVIAYAGRCPKGFSYWHCRCICGTEVHVRHSSLMAPESKSCGCLTVERITARNTTHGQKYSPLYSTWNDVYTRCTNPKSIGWPRYGGAGITMCEKWRNSFEAFAADVGQPPSAKHSIDRIDGSKGYEPGNVRWATILEQQRNRRDNLILEYDGQSHCLSEWSDITHINRSTITNRIKRGATVGQALGFEPLADRRWGKKTARRPPP